MSSKSNTLRKIKRDSKLFIESGLNTMYAGGTPGKRANIEKISPHRPSSRSGKQSTNSPSVKKPSSPKKSVEKMATQRTSFLLNKSSSLRSSTASSTSLEDDLFRERHGSVKGLIEFYSSSQVSTSSPRNHARSPRNRVQENEEISRQYRVAAKIKQESIRNDRSNTKIEKDAQSSHQTLELSFQPIHDWFAEAANSMTKVFAPPTKQEVDKLIVKSIKHDASAGSETESKVSSSDDMGRHRRHSSATSLQEAIKIERDRFEIVKSLLSIPKFSIDTTPVTWTPYNYNALTSAALLGSVDVVKFLLSHGADVNHVNKDGTCALYLASKNGFYECVKLLLDGGADEVNENLNQALMFSVKGADNFADSPNKFQCCDKVVRLLIKRGANPNYADPNQNMKTPLMQLIEWYYNDMSSGWPLLLLEILLSERANMHQTDKNGNSAWSIAHNLSTAFSSQHNGRVDDLIEAMSSHSRRSKARVRLMSDD